MTDDTAARLRALAERARNAESERAAAADRGDIDGFRTANNHRLDFRAAASPDSILALLDALDEARRERDEARRHHAENTRLIEKERGRVIDTLRAERDALAALLRTIKPILVTVREGSVPLDAPLASLIAEIDALDGAKGK